MIVYCIILKDTDTVELFTDLRSMTDRYDILMDEQVAVAVTSTEL